MSFTVSAKYEPCNDCVRRDIDDALCRVTPDLYFGRDRMYEAHFVYELIHDSRLKYVGCTYHPIKRLHQHISTRKISDIELGMVIECCCHNCAFQLETDMLYGYGVMNRPEWNKWPGRYSSSYGHGFDGSGSAVMDPEWNFERFCGQYL